MQFYLICFTQCAEAHCNNNVAGFHECYTLFLFVLLFFCLKKMKKIKNRRYMKKNYVSPLATEVNVAAETMLAASLQISNDKTVNTSQGGQLSGGSRGEWGNLWE